MSLGHVMGMSAPLPLGFDPAVHVHALSEGLVKANRHPSVDLWIYNYTPEAQYSGALKTTRALGHYRGLIVDDTGRIVARGFPKFFNLGELTDEDRAYEGKPFRVEEKVDGSLGILYHDGLRWAVATRGSFVSEQAQEATRILYEKYTAWLSDRSPAAGYTVLFEIVYPENRIVVDYGERRDLVLLGAINNETCVDAPSLTTLSWPGPKSGRFETVPAMSAADIATHLGQSAVGQEGFVLVYPDGRRVKVKLADYLRLHRIVTGCNERSVWEALRDGKIGDMLAGVPDEFFAWVERVKSRLETEHQARRNRAAWEFVRLRRVVDTANRKAFAAEAVKTGMSALLFAILDNKDIEPMVWKAIEPSGANASPFAAREVA